MMIMSCRMHSLVALLALWLRQSQAAYVSYEKPKAYAEGESVPLFSNKLTSPQTLSAMDYSQLPLCFDLEKIASSSSKSKWQEAIDALHGDVHYSGPPYQLNMLQDVYCGQLCVLDLSSEQSTTIWQDAIEQDFRYHFMVDGMPIAYRTEDDSTVATNYWAGVPLGEMVGGSSRYESTSEEDAFVYNHLNIEILYFRTSNDKYKVVRTTIEAFSIQHSMSDDDGTIQTPINSCQLDVVDKEHTNFEMLLSTPPQLASGMVPMTYDVIWREWTGTDDPSDNRWDIFLTMDDSIPRSVQLASIFVAIFINVILIGVIYTWVMRDLSYKPIITETEEVSEDQAREIQLWPLSTRIFFPPAVSPFWLCISCGTGAQLLATALVFIFFFQVGVINQSLGSGIVTPAAVIYTVFALVGGYVTARLYRVFHGSFKKAMGACCVVMIAFPLLGLIVVPLVYDVLPEEIAPQLNTLSSCLPLILLWILGMCPLTLLGGLLGYRHGVIQNFPVSEGSKGYQDLNLQSEGDRDDVETTKCTRCWRRSRTFVLLLTGGILPILCCFVTYAYGIAGPVFLGYFVSTRLVTIIPFLLFTVCTGAVAILAYYREIRASNYGWWWASFITGGSSGVYVFILSLTWLFFNVSVGDLSSNAFAVYAIWFAFVSLGVFLMCGFVGVACCIWFNRKLYSFAMNRSDQLGTAISDESA